MTEGREGWVLRWLGRGVGATLTQLESDAKMLLGGVRGEAPAPFMQRQAPVWGAAKAPRSVGHEMLQVLRVEPAAEDAVSLVLHDPSGRALRWQAGQFFTLKVRVLGVEHRRAYSVSWAESAAEPPGSVRVTVQRVPGGMVSERLVRDSKAGDWLAVEGPAGRFVLPDAVGEVVLLGGGSGVTPLVAMAQEALGPGRATRVVMLLGARNHARALHEAALQALAAESGGRMVLHSLVDQRAPGDDAAVREGRLDAATLGALLDEAQVSENARYFMCGPEAMLGSLRATLLARGVSASAIEEERFVRPGATRQRGSAEAQPVTLRVLGREVTVAQKPGQTLLDAGLVAGVEMPFSCTMGGCGACRVKLIAGEVSQEEPNCLRAHERDAGMVLACVARAEGPVTVEVP